MILLPNLLKFYHKKQVEKYSFNEYLEEAKKTQTEEETVLEPEEPITEELEEAALEEPEEPEEILPEEPEEPQEEPESMGMGDALARIHAEEILSQAREEAEAMQGLSGGDPRNGGRGQPDEGGNAPEI